MPYKEPRLQVNLKLTPTEYAALLAEATLADATVAQYARQLIVERVEQPLSARAHRVKEQMQQREEALREQLAHQQQQLNQLRLENIELGPLRQRVATLLAEQQSWQDSGVLKEMIREAIEQKYSA